MVALLLVMEGHQFILDAYTTENYFRVNWGWSGHSNGFFLISALNPNDQGAGGSTGGGFIANQDALFGLSRQKEIQTIRLCWGCLLEKLAVENLTPV